MASDRPVHYERLEKRGTPIGHMPKREPCIDCKDKGFILRNGNYGKKKVYCTCPIGDRMWEQDASAW